MGDYNLIQRGELQDRLVRGLVMRERSPAPNLSPEVQAVVILEDLAKQSVFFQAVERRWGVIANIGAVAAEFTAVALENPAGSGLVAVIDSIVASTGTGMEFHFGRGASTGLITRNSAIFFDSRNGDASACGLFSGTNAATNITLFLHRRRVSASEELMPQNASVVLQPGEILSIEAATVNIGAAFSVSGRDYIG